jgi:hypothetical protein
MKDLLILLAHLLTTIARLLGSGGAKAVVADGLLMKQQLLIINRSRQRAPNLLVLDQLLLGFPWQQETPLEGYLLSGAALAPRRPGALGLGGT